jgi:hypothetical protein
MAAMLVLSGCVPVPVRADDAEDELQSQINDLQERLQAQRDQERWDRLSDDINCGKITGWARSAFKHGKGH